ncbi:MAG TPA: Calx-beta domain-containing protein [Pyrinomonadaceae bacterium]|nr:Calx-beta domain-containing protein [Pyrinomonadaceae bacterium]
MSISILFCLVIILAGGERAGAAGGGLDPSFSPGGSGANGIVDVVAVQPDGKALVGGRFTSYNGNAAASDRVARLNTDGTLDTSFNPAGLGSDGIVLAIAVQPDGKIIIGGTFLSYNRNGAAGDRIARLNPNGTLDTTFNPGGVGADGNVFAVALQPDGKILIGGRFYNYNGTAREGVARLNPDGTLDASFNPSGSGVANLSAIAVQPDGKIVVAGLFALSDSVPGSMGKITRLNSDGTRDASFNPGGAGADGVVNAVALQPNGKILIGGSFTMYNGDAAMPDKVARLNSNGTRDTTFNAGGSGADASQGRYPEVTAVALQPDGRIVIGGAFDSYNGDAAASDSVIRLNSNGSLDASFNPGGSGADSFVHALALQADGKVLVGGDFTSYNGDAAANDRVARLLPAAGEIAFSAASQSVAETAANAVITLTRTGGTDNKVVAKVALVDETTAPADYRFRPGTLDTTFNPGGARADATISAVAVQPDGKVIIAGDFTSYDGNDAASNGIARLNANGTLDTTFNPGGSGVDNSVSAVAVQPDGKIIIGGNFTSYNGNAAASDCIARLNANGTLDTSFNPGGAGMVDSSVLAVALQPDGKVVIGGAFDSYNGNSAASDKIARLNANGSLDETFNSGGAGVDGTVVYAVAVQSDGKIVIGGIFTGYNGNSAASDGVARLNANGTLDTSFNSGGAGVNTYAGVAALAVQPDGRIIIGGNFIKYNGANPTSPFLARLYANGKLDTTFKPPAAGPTRTVSEVSLQPDGKVIVGRSFIDYNSDPVGNDWLARLNPNGTLDATFNSGAGTDGSVLAIIVQPNGKVIIAGNFFNDYGGVGYVSKLNGDLFVTWPAGDASNKTVLLPIVNDTAYEGNETLNLAVSVLAGGASLGAPAASALTIVDNEAPPKLAVNSVAAAEGNSGSLSAVFTVRLSAASGKPVTVQYHTVNATAVAPDDYTTVPPTTLTFSPGETSKTVAVTVKGDLIDELDETFKLVLSNPTNATVLTGAGVCTITDNDAASISINNVSLTEPDSGTASMAFTVKLSVASSRAVSVKYQTANNTAIAPGDYTALALTTLSFSPGVTSRTITVQIKGDPVKELNETLFVNLSGAVNATISDAQGLGTVTNDD